MRKPIFIEGFAIYIDNSGDGHNWRFAGNDDCLPSIQQEIAAEIIDGGNDKSDEWNEYRATNGINYRW